MNSNNQIPTRMPRLPSLRLSSTNELFQGVQGTGLTNNSIQRMASTPTSIRNPFIFEEENRICSNESHHVYVSPYEQCDV